MEVADKDDVSNVYEIPVGTLKEYPLEDEVIHVLVEDNTYIVPKDDLPLEKYPLDTDVKSVIKFSKDKMTPKIYIVKKEELKQTSVDEEVL